MIYKNKSIKSKLYKNNALLILVIVVILEVGFILGMKSYYMTSAKTYLMNKAYGIQEYYNETLSDFSLQEKSRLLMQNESKDTKFLIEIYDSLGNLFINSYGENSLTFKNNLPSTILEKNSKMEVYQLNDYNRKEIVVDIILEEREKRVGFVRLISDVNDVYIKIYSVAWLLLLGGVVVIGISFIFSSFMAQDIINSIRELTKAARAISEGDLDIEIKKRSNDEIGTLYDTINYMSKEIKKSNMAKDDFLASVSHELRTPLAAIRGWSELMKEDISEEDKKIGLDIITVESRRLGKMVDNILDFSKLQAERIDLTLEKMNIADLLEETSHSLKKQFMEKKIEFTLKIESIDNIVHGDWNRLKQVFLNILDNAIKFTPAGGSVSILCKGYNDYILITVADTGEGIQDEDLELVTEKFFKGSGRNSGTGLGLALSKEIIHLHEGELNIDSIPDRGTTVSIKIFR